MVADGGYASPCKASPQEVSMAWKTSVLVVANQTADSDELLEARRPPRPELFFRPPAPFEAVDRFRGREVSLPPPSFFAAARLASSAAIRSGTFSGSSTG